MADGVSPVVDTNLGPPAAAQANPIASAGGIVGVMSDLAEMRNRQNANILFQQQMSARHQLGQDLTVWASQGLSPEEQIARASHQPYAPFVTPEIANFRSSNLAGAQVQQAQALTGQALAGTEEIRSRLTGTGLAKVGDIFAASGGDPEKLDQLFKAGFGAATPTQQAAMKKAYPALRDSLLSNLPDEPDAKAAELKSRAARIGMSVGVPLDRMFAGAGAVPLQVAEMPGGGKSVVGGLPDQQQPPLVVQPPATAPGSAPGASPPKALDGSPLFAPDAALPSQFKTNLTGTKAYASPLRESIAADAAKRWSADQPKYEQIAQSNATIGNMLDEVRTSAKNGGGLATGFAGESRTALANMVNTAYGWFNPGSSPPIDPTKIAANEAMAKNAHQLAFQVVSQATGQSREALGTLQMGYNSVPNMDKTPLGNLVVGEVLQATGNWLLQKQEFMRDWAARTGGDLTNAEAEYLKEHPPAKVVSAALAEHGIGPEGYTSRAAFLRDFHDGLLTSGKEAPLETAATIAHQKGWITDKQFQAAKASGYKGGFGETKP